MKYLYSNFGVRIPQSLQKSLIKNLNEQDKQCKYKVASSTSTKILLEFLTYFDIVPVEQLYSIIGDYESLSTLLKNMANILKQVKRDQLQRNPQTSVISDIGERIICVALLLDRNQYSIEFSIKMIDSLINELKYVSNKEARNVLKLRISNITMFGKLFSSWYVVFYTQSL